MYSTIYYPVRRLMADEEAQGGVQAFVRNVLASFRKGSTFITNEHITAVLALPGLFTSVHPALAPFYEFAVRPAELWYEHEVLGKLFIPRNIYMKAPGANFFIVQIDDAFELCNWPGCSLPPDHPEKLIIYPALPEERKDMERSFAALLVRNGIIAPPTDDARYFEREGSAIIIPENGGVAGMLPTLPRQAPAPMQLDPTPLTTANLTALLALLQVSLAEEDLTDIVDAANDPLNYFTDHEGYFAKRQITEPYENIYRDILIEALIAQEVLEILEGKESLSEVNAALATLSKGALPNLLTRADGVTATALVPVAKQRLRTRNLALLTLDTNSDGHTLLLVPIHQAKAVTLAAEKCGLRIY